MNGQNILQQFPIVRLQMLHVLLFLRRLQLPNEVQAVGGLGLVTVEDQSNDEDKHENGVDEKCDQVRRPAYAVEEYSMIGRVLLKHYLVYLSR